MNLVTVKVVSGEKINILKDIFFNYLRDQMFIDILLIIIMAIDLYDVSSIIGYFKLIVLAKVPFCL
jgi:hypothetical protein